MADEKNLARLARIARHFHVHLGYQRTGGIEHFERTVRRLHLDRARDAVSAEDHGRAVGHFAQLLDENRANGSKAIHHVFVVDHLVAHVDRGAEQIDGAFHDVDGAIDAGTETAGIG